MNNDRKAIYTEPKLTLEEYLTIRSCLDAAYKGFHIEPAKSPMIRQTIETLEKQAELEPAEQYFRGDNLGFYVR